MQKRTTDSARTGRPITWKRRSGRLEPAAGHDGAPLPGSTICRNGRLQYVGAFVDLLAHRPSGPVEPSRLPDLRRRLAKARAQYRLSGAFTARELDIMDLAFDGHSLTAIGLRIGMTRQGVEYHVQRLFARAPLFRRFWRYKNRMRGRR